MLRHSAAMRLGVLALALCQGTLPGARGANLKQPVLPLLGATDPSSKPCSCDCCVAVERLPSEVIVNAQGQMIKEKCAKGRDDLCPTFCARTLEQPLQDYSRFCHSSCAPSFATSGAACGFVDADEKEKGGSVVPADFAQPEETKVDNLEDRDLGAAYARLQAQLNKAKAKKKKETQMTLKFSLSKLIANRLRAEAGADISHGAATGERVRINSAIVERNVEKVVRLKEALASVQTQIDEAGATSKASADSAKEAAKKTGMLLKAAEANFGPAMRDTKKLVAQYVEEQTVAAAREEAEAYRVWKDWDKPEGWSRSLANRAALPHLRGMVEANQRQVQYRSYAEGLEDEAARLRAKADQYTEHLKGMAVTGDVILRASEANERQQLINRAGKLEFQAREYYKVSEDAAGLAPRYQEAASQASAYEGAMLTKLKRDANPYA